MDTGEYTDNTNMGSMLGIWYPLIFISITQIGTSLLNLSKEDHEDKIKVLLKQIGISAAVEVCQSALMYFSCMFILSTPFLYWG